MGSMRNLGFDLKQGHAGPGCATEGCATEGCATEGCATADRTEENDLPGNRREQDGRQGSRRRFLLGASLVLGAAGSHALPSVAQAKAGQGDLPAGTKPFKISLAQWSLHKELEASRLDPLDFAKVASGFGIDAIEYVTPFYKGKHQDRSYLAELKRRATGEGCWSLLIRIDGEGDIVAPEAKRRQHAMENHKKWVEAAAFLGCHAVRVKLECQGDEDDQAKKVSDALRRLCEFSDSHGVDVLVENHGGLSSKGGWLADVLAAVGHPRCGSLPDFGGFDLGAGQKYDRYQGVRELMPYARAVSAKALDFDPRGDETTINYPLMLKIVTDAGYRGYVSIDYEGTRLSEQAGIERTKALLERVRDQLSSRADRRG
jgi:L-ribulose-5-phosphate 3-epimerase